MSKTHLCIPKPSLEDERGDWDRLAAGLAEGGTGLKAGLDLLAELPVILRAEDFNVTVTQWADRILTVEPGDGTRPLQITLYAVCILNERIKPLGLVQAATDRDVSGCLFCTLYI